MWPRIEVRMGRSQLYSCARKIRYGHESSAAKAAIHMRVKYGKEFQVYSCSFCEGWHIGKPSIWDRIRMALKNLEATQ